MKKRKIIGLLLCISFISIISVLVQFGSAELVSGDWFYSRPIIADTTEWYDSNNMIDDPRGDTSTYGGYSRDCGTSSCGGVNYVLMEFNYKETYSEVTLHYTYSCTPSQLANLWDAYDFTNENWISLETSETCDGNIHTSSISIETDYINPTGQFRLRFLTSTYYPDTYYRVYDIYTEQGFPQLYTGLTPYFDQQTGEGLYLYCVWDLSKDGTHLDGNYFAMETGYCPEAPKTYAFNQAGNYNYTAEIIGINLTEGVSGTPYVIDEVQKSYNVYYTAPDPVSLWSSIKVFMCNRHPWLWFCSL